MSSQIPSTPKPHATHPIEATQGRPKIDSAKLLPAKLSDPVTLESFKRGMERVKNHYPVHSETGVVIDGLGKGLDLKYEPGLPPSKTLRAIASALAEVFENKQG